MKKTITSDFKELEHIVNITANLMRKHGKTPTVPTDIRELIVLEALIGVGFLFKGIKGIEGNDIIETTSNEQLEHKSTLDNRNLSVDCTSFNVLERYREVMWLVSLFGSFAAKGIPFSHRGKLLAVFMTHPEKLEPEFQNMERMLKKGEKVRRMPISLSYFTNGKQTKQVWDRSKFPELSLLTKKLLQNKPL